MENWQKAMSARPQAAAPDSMVPSAHAPESAVHAPPEHTGVAPEHAVPLVHIAVVGLQVCGVLPEH